MSAERFANPGDAPLTPTLSPRGGEGFSAIVCGRKTDSRANEELAARSGADETDFRAMRKLAAIERVS